MNATFLFLSRKIAVKTYTHHDDNIATQRPPPRSSVAGSSNSSSSSSSSSNPRRRRPPILVQGLAGLARTLLRPGERHLQGAAAGTQGHEGARRRTENWRGEKGTVCLSLEGKNTYGYDFFSLVQDDFLDGDVIPALIEESVQTEEEKEKEKRRRRPSYPLLSARGAGLTLAGSYDTQRSLLHGAASNDLAAAGSRRPPPPAKRYRHFDAPDQVRMKSTGSRHLEDHFQELRDYGDYGVRDEDVEEAERWGQENKISYDYYAVGRVEDEDVDVITPFSTSTFRPVAYDYTIGDVGDASGSTAGTTARAPTSRPRLFGAERPFLMPTARPVIKRLRPVATATTTKTTTTTTTTTTATTAATTTASWHPSGPKLHKGTTKYPKYIFRKKAAKRPRKLRSNKTWRPKSDREKIRKRFLDSSGAKDGDGRNEVAEEYPRDDAEKFPHFPANRRKSRPVIEKPAGRADAAAAGPNHRRGRNNKAIFFFFLQFTSII